MATIARRIVDKWLADKIKQELELLRDDEINGSGTVFAVLTHVLKLHSNDVKRVETEFTKTLVRLRRSAKLPDRWRDVRAALESDSTTNANKER